MTSPLHPPARSIRIAILAMGGEGGGVLADWIVGLAEANGYIAQLTSVPGVAQRTGATNYYIELFPEVALPAGRQPVLALTPFPGDVDIVIASELMEAGRAIQRGIVTPDRTTLVTSTARVFAMAERLAVADGRVDAGRLLEACRAAAQRLVALDLAEIAARNGSVISAAMLGALAGARVLPFERAAYEGAITSGGVGVAASLAAFAAAHDAVTSEKPAAATPTPVGDAAADGPELPPAARALLDEATSEFAPQTHRDAGRGCGAPRRLPGCRLRAAAAHPAAADRSARCPHGDGSHRLTIEVARWLALGMAYEDTIRVAELKIRASRFDRVRREARASDAMSSKSQNSFIRVCRRSPKACRPRSDASFSATDLRAG